MEVDMQRNGDRLRVILFVLLVSSAALFAIGAAVERHHAPEQAPVTGESGSEGGSTESGSEGGSTESGSEGGSTEGGGETKPSETPAPESSGERSSEKLLGVDPEAPWVVITGVILSLALAAGVWFLRRRWVLGMTIGFGIVLAALDVRELVHQVHESRPSLIVVASILAVLHLLVATTAAILMRASAADGVVA
jgi:hypothetical protein